MKLQTEEEESPSKLLHLVVSCPPYFHILPHSSHPLFASFYSFVFPYFSALNRLNLCVCV